MPFSHNPDFPQDILVMAKNNKKYKKKPSESMPFFYTYLEFVLGQLVWIVKQLLSGKMSCNLHAD